jgi:hypothetical protein
MAGQKLVYDYYRERRGSWYWLSSNLREWLNSDQENVGYTNEPPNSSNLGSDSYADEAGFLTNFTTAEKNAIAVTRHRGYTRGVDSSVKDGGSTDLNFSSSFDTPFANYYCSGVEDNWGSFNYKISDDKVFLFSPVEIHHYSQSRNFNIKKAPSQYIRNKYNISSNYIKYTVQNGEHYDRLCAISDEGTFSSTNSDSTTGIAPAIHLKPDYTLDSGKKVSNLKVGEEVVFGNYGGHQISWIVVNKTPDDFALLWSKEVITLKAYDSPNDDFSWEYSDHINFSNYDVNIINDLQKWYPTNDKTLPRLYLLNEDDLNSRQDGGWTLKLQAEDTGSGIEKIVLPDGTEVYDNYAEYYITENKRYFMHTVDNAGNRNNLTIPVSNINPPSSVDINSSSDGWTNSDVNVEIKASNDVNDYYANEIITNSRDWYGPAWPNSISYTGKTFRVTGNIELIDHSADLGNVRANVGFRYIRRYNKNDGYDISNSWPTIEHFYLRDINGTQASFDFEYTVPGDYYKDIRPFLQIGVAHHNHNYTVKYTNVKYELLDKSDFGIDYIKLPNGQKIYQDTYTTTITEEGTYTFEVMDNRGVVTSRTIEVLIETNPPDLNISQEVTKKTNQSYDLIVNASDSESGVKRILQPNGEWVESDSLRYNIYQNGTYEFTAEDNAGNRKTKSITVSNIDKTSPVDPNIHVVDKGENHVTLNWIADDTESDIDSIRLYFQESDSDGNHLKDIDINGDGNTEYDVDVTGQESYTINGLNDYTYYRYYLRVIDSVDNVRNDGYHTVRTQDTTGPIVDITSHNDNTNIGYIDGNQLTLSGTADDNGEVDRVILNASGAVTLNDLVIDDSSPENWSYTRSYPEGHTRLEVKAIDKAGNESDAKYIEFDVDTEAPQIVWNNHTDKSWRNTVPDVHTNNIDINSGISTSKLAVTSNTTKPSDWINDSSPSNTYFQNTLEGKPDGEWYCHVEVTDNNGNSTYSYQGPFKIDRSEPTHVSHSISGADYVRDNNYYVKPNREFYIEVEGEENTLLSHNYLNLNGDNVDIRAYQVLSDESFNEYRTGNYAEIISAEKVNSTTTKFKVRIKDNAPNGFIFNVNGWHKNEAGTLSRFTTDIDIIVDANPAQMNGWEIKNAPYFDGNTYWGKQGDQMTFNLKGYDDVSGAKRGYIQLVNKETGDAEHASYNRDEGYLSDSREEPNVDVTTGRLISSDDKNMEIEFDFTLGNQPTNYDLCWYWYDNVKNTMDYTDTGKDIGIEIS